MENIDAILYINLAHRSDRNVHILNEIKKLCTDESKIHRIDAIHNKKDGALGCSMSHIKVLEYILEHPEWNNCLVLEDDFTFKSDNIEENNKTLDSFFKEFPNFDCCNITFNPGVGKYENTNIDIIKHLYYTYTTSGYIITKTFLPILLRNFRESVNDRIIYGEKASNCIDVHWCNLMPVSKWYVFIPPLGFQCDGYSDITKRFESHKC
jgi:GR25 family glycosyltransferase involved in LPS biosynthesis